MENENDNLVLINQAEKLIGFTLCGGFIIGLVGLIGYPLTIAEIGTRLLFIGLLLAIASLISGFFIGTLFGMPKRNNEKESDYTLNNSLVEISEWLTKIIVGLGLVNLIHIPHYLMSIGEYVRMASGNKKEESIDVFTVCVVVYFAIFGLYIGYNYMRLVLSQKYKDADDNILRKEVESLTKKTELLQNIANVKEEQNKKLFDVVNEVAVPLSTQSAFKEGVNNTDETAIKSLIEKAKKKLNKGMLRNSKDPQNGQWGGDNSNNDRELIATVEEIGNNLFKINLKVISTNINENPIKDSEIVLFALHPTFGDPPFRIIETKNGTAELTLYSYGSFSVGVFADNGNTELELDLAALPGVSNYFKAN